MNKAKGKIVYNFAVGQELESIIEAVKRSGHYAELRLPVARLEKLKEDVDLFVKKVYLMQEGLKQRQVARIERAEMENKKLRAGISLRESGKAEIL